MDDEPEKDKFGLPIRWTFLDSDYLERIAATKALVRDSVAAVLHQVVDPEILKRMFREEIACQTAKPPRGKQPNKKVNEHLLTEFCHQRALGLDRTAAVRATAEKAKTELTLGTIDSIESQIWTLIRKDKAEAQKAAEAWRRWDEHVESLEPTLLEKFDAARGKPWR